jgi:hypothetical protein
LTLCLCHKTAADAAEADGKTSPFRFVDVSDTTVQLTEDGKPVFSYNHGTITDESVPENDHRRRCGCYIHPLWGLNGEILTDAFPPDHYHHQGIFWRWKTVEVDGRNYSHWVYDGIETRFVKWLERRTDATTAELAVENGWFVGDTKVMVERVSMRARRSDGQARSLDIRLTLIPGDKPVTLTGAKGKSYGGLTARFDAWPRTDVVVRAPGATVQDEGRTGLAAKGDLAETPLPWADFASQFPGGAHRSGAAVFIHPSHPDYPPTWLTRCYGAMCVGWPGVKSQTLEPGKPVVLRYRIWIHKTELDHAAIEQAYEAYKTEAESGGGE